MLLLIKLKNSYMKNVYLFFGVYDLEQLLNLKVNLIPFVFKNLYPWKVKFKFIKKFIN